ncbi:MULTISPECIES: phosphoglucomutase (alpha-D-glucose-1,6-bisphosphate-dependent) [Desulfovibrio]|uniref:Phosphoglucomutase n=1 Tax=Desulfovibrio desulfuricans TaxID=876 RepID=A0AA94HSI4_DESDE|nr:MULTISPECIES: phosphoglucomutase (alpha-D-glucose-1,6-bisphosphate-dependent) [Desulfovibrio]ATD81301.1 alpha-D-glucose phosphate-specific phosphoglucomutase [Desulfovibrio sp. G11]SFW44440.1 phosphoglucomutase [Desulfovibrio desulfuricans]SPD36939.1 phosphoglucomutase (alpha-D-glucose-1,6-bisphosphate-dependent) [Desulfovibrio sp. G11]
MPVVHARAGQLPLPEDLENIPALVSAYFTEYPNPAIPAQRVSFGTSGHRGSSQLHTFNEEHIYAITQAVCDYRKVKGIDGPLFLGGDTHALSEAAFRSALEVLVANDVHVRIAPRGIYTATPAISHAILRWNAGRSKGLADGIVITPSHNPPRDGGFKYNPPHGGPAETDVTDRIEKGANAYLENGNRGVHLTHLRAAQSSSLVEEYDFIRTYVDDLPNVLDVKAIAASGLRLGVDPLGGASLQMWEPIADAYGIEITVVNKAVDPTFRFVPFDKDGKIRMDCSSPYAMNGLLEMRDRFDLAVACDPDSDRHGIVTGQGLMNPNHFLSVAAWYLFRTRRSWSSASGIGKTLVTSALLDRVGQEANRPVVEVPVGFKWFVPYLLNGHCGMGCEESAGASFLRFDGSPWSTDKDGPLMCLLAAEMLAVEQSSPAELYEKLTERLGCPVYQRLDAPADDQVRAKLKALTPESADIASLGGSPVTEIITRAPGNDAPIGGIKISSADGWFAVRPSGTEPICKVYTESFKGEEHLCGIQKDAMNFLERLLKD